VGRLFGGRDEVMNTSEKNLLILSHTYNSFIKDQVEIIAKDFKKVYVLVRYQPIAELSKYIPLSYVKSRAKYSKQYSIDLSNLPGNVEVTPVPLWYLPFKSLYYSVGKQHARAVLNIIKKKKIKFDLIHAHFGWSAGYAGMRVKERYNKPLIITAHGYDVYDLPFRNEKFNKTLKKVYTSADKVITVSDKNRQYLTKLGVENVSVLPNGYSKEIFYHKDQKICREELGLPMNRKLIFTIGNLEKVKGYEYLIDALNIVKKKYPDILLLHIGGGPLESVLKQKVKNLGLENEYRFLGKKPHSELVNYFGACDSFISSSLNEGNPTVMFESLACGKPFIGTKVGGVPEIINSPDYGLLADPGDSVFLADNILKSLDTKWDTQRILQYSKQFSWENISKKILNIYTEVL